MGNKLLLILLLSCSLSFAQKDTLKQHLIKFSPLQLFDLDNSLSFGYEKVYKPKRSWQLEVGYGHSNANFWIALNENMGNTENRRGFHILRARTELRRYFRKNETSAPLGNYVAYELMSKYVFKKDEILIGRDPIAGVPSYSELVAGQSQKLVFGFHPKLGRQFTMNSSDDPTNEKWLFDAFVGVGFRVVSNQFSYANSRPNDQLWFNDIRSIGTIVATGRTAPIVSGTLGFKIAYLLN